MVYGAIRILLVVYLAGLACLWGCADAMIFHPPQSTYQDTPDIIKIKTVSGKTISAMYWTSPRAEWTFLFSHGNAEDLGVCLPFLRAVQAQGFNILAYDYQGYGTSQGRPSVSNTYEDIEAAYRYLTERIGTAPSRILVHGRSVGSGPSTWLAERKPVGGLVLEGAFTSILRVVFPVRLVPFDLYDNLGRIRKINCPVLVIHGDRDDIIPIRHGRTLYEQANNPKFCLWMENAGHNNLFWSGNGYWTSLHRLAEAARSRLPEQQTLSIAK